MSKHYSIEREVILELLEEGDTFEWTVRQYNEIARLAKLGLEIEEKAIVRVKKKEFPHNSHHTECHWKSCPGDCFERYGK